MPFCQNCGTEIPDQTKFCPECGQATVNTPPGAAPASTPPPENTYFESGGVTVTSTRAILGGKTYAMTNITSVAMDKTGAKIVPGLILLILGILISGCGLVVEGTSRVLGLFIGIAALIVGILALIAAKPSYIVRIGSSSGEANALSSRNQEHIQAIVGAMNQAIVDRG